MAATGQTPAITHAPPTLPSLPGAGAGLTSYLHSLSLWASRELSAKLSSTQALPGILLQANDTAAGAAPKVFLIQVNTAGAISATPVAIASGEF